MRGCLQHLSQDVESEAESEADRWKEEVAQKRVFQRWCEEVRSRQGEVWMREEGS